MGRVAVRAAAPTVPARVAPAVPVPAVRPVGRVVTAEHRPLRRPVLRYRPSRQRRVPRPRARAAPLLPRHPLLRVRPLFLRHPGRLPFPRHLPPRDPGRAVAPTGVTRTGKGRECSSSDRVAHSPPTRCRIRRGALDGPTRRNGHGYPPDAVKTPGWRPPSVVLAGQTGRHPVVVTKNPWAVRASEHRSRRTERPVPPTASSRDTEQARDGRAREPGPQPPGSPLGPPRRRPHRPVPQDVGRRLPTGGQRTVPPRGGRRSPTVGRTGTRSRRPRGTYGRCAVGLPGRRPTGHGDTGQERVGRLRRKSGFCWRV